jgi:predicted NAD/FAD-binding protein
MNIAIIGGGIGGLAVAYNIASTWPSSKGPPPTITVYEASNRFGGNGDTVTFDLGYFPTIPNPISFTRWADLGVNDFNKTAYTNIVEVMNTIGYTGYAPLEDTTSYYTLDGSIALVDGEGLVTLNTMMPEPLSDAVTAFMTQAAQDATNPAYANYTIRQYIETVFVNNPAYDGRLGPQIIYPRVNGMYFTDEMAPSELPLTSVMHYYAIQEGAGGAPAERMYFVGGASSWIEALTSYMRSTMNINLVTNFAAQLQYVGNAWQLYNSPPGVAPTGAPVTPNPDVVVVATHADDAAKIITGGVPAEVISCLSRVRYLNGMAVAHTFAGMMPPDANAWTTYNILIHQEATYLKPYTISYSCNRHQNDGANPEYASFGGPQFFVTLNPPVPIPSQYVLTDKTTGKPAIANLRHNVFDFACQAAQTEIVGYQGNNNLYFAGGWTCGAGLHEECWIQGQKIAAQIVTGTSTNDHVYDLRRGEAYAPAYLRRLLRRV